MTGSPADAIEPTTGPPTESRLFWGLGAFALFLAIVYGTWTKIDTGTVEFAGTVALVFASCFSLFFGTFLDRSLRRVQADVEAAEEAEDAGDTDDQEILYLPDSSIWPIGIGVGLSITLAGVALGWWVLLPGIALFVHSVIGFAAQSRDRS